MQNGDERMKTEPNTKRKLISKRLVDISSLVEELRKKNPYPIYRDEWKGWILCVDELERLLKEKK